jgi:hypothetical protein
MEDPLVIIPKTLEESELYHMDIDIHKGWFAPVPGLAGDNTTNCIKQRSCVAALVQSGTIPGKEDFGAEWGKFIANDITIVELDNQVKQNMATIAGEENALNLPMPMYLEDKETGGIRLFMYTPGTESAM